MNTHIIDAIASGASYDHAARLSLLFDLSWDYMGGLTVTHMPTGETRYVEHWDYPDTYAASPELLAELFE